MAFRVVVTDHGFAGVERERSAATTAGAEFDEFQAKTASEVAEAVKGASVAVVQFAPFDAEAVAAMAPGGTVIRYGAGYDNIDVAAARSAGIHVAYVPDYCTEEVADHTAALTLALLRRIPQLDASVRRGEWSVLKAAPAIRPADDVTIGFLGLGRIGRETMKRLQPFGFQISYFDPGAVDDIAGAVRRISAEDLFANADVFVLHLPLSAETRHVIDAAAMRQMPKGAVIINTARGGLVDEGDLVAMIEQGHIAAAALDVFEQEPLAADSPLRTCSNIVLHPHAAWYSDKALDRLQQLVAHEISLALSGSLPRCPVPA